MGLFLASQFYSIDLYILFPYHTLLYLFSLSFRIIKCFSYFVSPRSLGYSGSLVISYEFQSQLAISIRYKLRFLNRVALNQQINSVSIAILTMLSLPVCKHWKSFHYLGLSFLSMMLCIFKCTSLVPVWLNLLISILSFLIL